MTQTSGCAQADFHDPVVNRSFMKTSRKIGKKAKKRINESAEKRIILRSRLGTFARGRLGTFTPSHVRPLPDAHESDTAFIIVTAYQTANVAQHGQGLTELTTQIRYKYVAVLLPVAGLSKQKVRRCHGHSSLSVLRDRKSR